MVTVSNRWLCYKPNEKLDGECDGVQCQFKHCELDSYEVHVTQIFFIGLIERAFKVMKNDIYFIVITLLVA